MTAIEYVRGLFGQEDEILTGVRQSIVDRGMPTISVSPEVGHYLTMLVKMIGAKHVLEIGALGGYSGICLARGLGADGSLTSLELEADYAELAHENLKKAGFGDQVQYRLGEALSSLEQLEQEGAKFDLFFIDADKVNYLNYYNYALKLANPGALIIGDNVLQSGRVYDPENDGENTLAIRAFNETIATDERVDSMLLPIGDGLSVTRVK
ncbi:putative O-methyltransferase YrrM [Tumebacillus sp. BK434]|uniref:O-methyltransferase n=1 Tax=Tumebacillus sp. BK434 TaxID=2512169 RepID=UPI0010442207|nr:O-methyltransferase [Tumebacillus sp. BK434]TCP53363.1 putative O-methyltransferase YrrM [Tumebacillus sp. BK434]